MKERKEKGSEGQKSRGSRGDRVARSGQGVRSSAVEHHSRTKSLRSRLARESAQLDPGVEQALAEEGIDQELVAWPAY